MPHDLAKYHLISELLAFAFAFANDVDKSKIGSQIENELQLFGLVWFGFAEIILEIFVVFIFLMKTALPSILMLSTRKIIITVFFMLEMCGIHFLPLTKTKKKKKILLQILISNE